MDLNPMLKIQIQLGNDDCQNVDDAWQIIERTARRINDGDWPPCASSGSLYDINGNYVGEYDEVNG
jgi:hypothetical protein